VLASDNECTAIIDVPAIAGPDRPALYEFAERRLDLITLAVPAFFTKGGGMIVSYHSFFLRIVL